MHFADKDELFFELCEQHFKIFAQHMEEAMSEPHDDPVRSLRRGGEAYIRFALENPEQYRVLFMSKGSVPKDREFEELSGVQCFMSLVASVQRCIDSGAFLKVDPFVTSVALWTSLHGLASLMITDEYFPWPDRDQLIDQLLDTLLRGLATTPTDVWQSEDADTTQGNPPLTS
jgi:AcrR family transcriptional regulator